MLTLNAFYHLPQLDALFDEIAHADSGIVIVAGMESRAHVDPGTAAGRGLVFSILARQTLDAQPRTRAALVSEHKDAQLRLSTRERYRVKHFFPTANETYSEIAARVAEQKYPLLLLEKLDAAGIAPAQRAAQNGLHVVTQLDTPLHGAWVARYLGEACGDAALAKLLHWVVAVRRLPRLCDICKQRDGEFFRAVGCAACNGHGYRGDLFLFDVWKNNSEIAPPSQPSVLSFETYAHELARTEFLAHADSHELDAAQLYHTFQILSSGQEQMNEAARSLRAQVTEMELGRRALEQQYRTSIALQDVGHKLLVLDTVQELAAYIARRAHELCGADRAVLYLLQGDGSAEIASLHGWDARWLSVQIPFQELFRGHALDGQSGVFAGYPPGIPKRVADVEGTYVRAGLLVQLIAQREVVGAMLFQSTIRKTFEARDIALLNALANAGAAAIQRADLIKTLRDKIEQLEAAQIEIAKKERLERELELARQVQQNMLPRIFPLLPGVAFYARNAPARAVGGDFYDVFVLDADRVGIVIADVSDKGMPAALFMALTRSLVRAEAPRERSPEIVLRRVHRLLREVGEPTQFVTLFYGVLDLTARSLTYVRAGHDYPLLVRGGALRLLDAPGTLLGFLEENEIFLQEARVQLEHGDSIILYTDGMTDALNDAGKEFGRDALQQIALAYSASPAQELGDALFDAVLQHQGAADAFDDMTLLIVQVK
jgi:serine phosphatase RsbU (regulator of sigma subunit)